MCLLVHLCLVFNLKMSNCLSRDVPSQKSSMLNAKCYFQTFHPTVPLAECLSAGGKRKYTSCGMWIKLKNQWRQYSDFTYYSIKHSSSSGRVQNVTVCTCFGFLPSLYLWSFLCTFCHLTCGCVPLWIPFICVDCLFFPVWAACQMYCILKGCEGVF